VGFIIYSGTGIRELVDRRPDARSAHQHVTFLTSLKRPNIRVFDPDGRPVSLEKLRGLAGQKKEKILRPSSTTDLGSDPSG
jgi:hypothetical protein